MARGDYRVELNRVAGRDAHQLWIMRYPYGANQTLMLQQDGSWKAYDSGKRIDSPTLELDGQTWREIKALLIAELGALPETAADTEVRVLRQWLDSERSRVERAFNRGLQ